MLPHVGHLRTESRLRVLEECLSKGRERFGFRLVHYSILGGHVHLIVEAEDARSLGRGMKGLGVRIARALNKLAGTHGKVLAERYHMVILRYPRQVRNALCYVLNNASSHSARRGFSIVGYRMDPASSGVFFDGWKEGTVPSWRRPAPSSCGRCGDGTGSSRSGKWRDVTSSSGGSCEPRTVRPAPPRRSRG